MPHTKRQYSSVHFFSFEIYGTPETVSDTSGAHKMWLAYRKTNIVIALIQDYVVFVLFFHAEGTVIYFSFCFVLAVSSTVYFDP
jgi:hypothetical protein